MIIHEYAHACMKYTCVCIYMHVCIYVYVYACMYACMKDTFKTGYSNVCWLNESLTQFYDVKII